MTYVIGPGERGQPVSVPTYKKPRTDRTKAHRWATHEEALSRLERTDRVAGQIIPGSTAFTFADSTQELSHFALVAGICPYKGREGIEFYPQELQLFRFSRPGPKSGLVWLRNIQVERSKYRIPQEDLLVETEFLHPLVKGPRIERFLHDYDGLIVALPYDAADPHRPVTRSILRQRSPLLLGHYEKYEDIIKAQTDFSDAIRGPDPGEFYGLARTGPYSFAKVYVAFRDNSKWRACVVESSQMPWGQEKRFVFQNHAVSVCERPDGSFISEDEAHYLCAILNAPIVERFIVGSSDNRSFKIRPPIHVPLFNGSDSRHKRLAKLSKEAHASEEIEIPPLRAEIEKTYLELCEERA